MYKAMVLYDQKVAKYWRQFDYYCECPGVVLKEDDLRWITELTQNWWAIVCLHSLFSYLHIDKSVITLLESTFPHNICLISSNKASKVKFIVWELHKMWIHFHQQSKKF